MEYRYIDEEFGEIVIRSDERVRKYGLSINQQQKIVLRLPYGGSEQAAISFLDSERAWIRSVLLKKQKKILGANDTNPLKTFTFTVVYESYSKSKVIGTINRNTQELTIRYPQNVDLNDVSVQDSIRHIIENALLIEAKRILPAWLSEIASRFGFVYSSIRIMKMKSRWGSCSSSKSIHLSSMLLLLPKKLIEFVMIHELCHTVEMNHGSRFHELVNQCVEGQESLLIEELKKFHCNI